MSNNKLNPFERLFKLQATVGKLVLDGKRDPELIASIFQKIVDENSFETVAATPTTAKWEVRDGVIYVTLPASDGTTGQGWIKRLKSKGFRLSEYAEGLLQSSDFKPTTGIVHRLAILSAKFWSDSERITRTIRAEGKKRKWNELNPEAICILRENFSDEDLEKMGFWYIVGIHEPIEVYGGPHFLYAYRRDDGRWLLTYWAYPDHYWQDGSAFAWSLPQVQS
ncbi:MAG: hypothetical protein AAB484_01415 [Patescibacteria group bacterium]